MVTIHASVSQGKGLIIFYPDNGHHDLFNTDHAHRGTHARAPVAQIARMRIAASPVQRYNGISKTLATTPLGRLCAPPPRGMEQRMHSRADGEDQGTGPCRRGSPPRRPARAVLDESPAASLGHRGPSRGTQSCGWSTPRTSRPAPRGLGKILSHGTRQAEPFLTQPAFQCQ